MFASPNPIRAGRHVDSPISEMFLLLHTGPMLSPGVLICRMGMMGRVGRWGRWGGSGLGFGAPLETARLG